MTISASPSPRWLEEALNQTEWLLNIKLCIDFEGARRGKVQDIVDTGLFFDVLERCGNFPFSGHDQCKPDVVLVVAPVVVGDAVEGVARLKDELDDDLVLSGCGELARTLIAHGVVDELRFWVHPAVGGEGSRPYGGDRISMRLLDATAFDSGVTLLRYEPLRP